ncbi:MAG: RraA family protein [Opitutaceae bacterium]|nr:RraA family protein [Opitutaceae bacterium]
MTTTARPNISLAHGDLLKLKRWNSCTIANALEQVSTADPLSLVNRDETRDFMPEMGPMVGYAVTVQITGSDPRIKQTQPDNFRLYREYLAAQLGPKIVVVEDLDAPACYGSIWGEVGANVARTLGCVGTITDGAIRDLDEMKNAGFKALARRLAVSHAYTWPVRWGVDVAVFGTRIKPGQLIHADKHGFIVIPDDASGRVLEAARFMDDNECDTVIPSARQQQGVPLPQVLEGMNTAGVRFAANARARYDRAGEWK